MKRLLTVLFSLLLVVGLTSPVYAKNDKKAEVKSVETYFDANGDEVVITKLISKHGDLEIIVETANGVDRIIADTVNDDIYLNGTKLKKTESLISPRAIIYDPSGNVAVYEGTFYTEIAAGTTLWTAAAIWAAFTNIGVAAAYLIIEDMINNPMVTALDEMLLIKRIQYRSKNQLYDYYSGLYKYMRKHFSQGRLFMIWGPTHESQWFF